MYLAVKELGTKQLLRELYIKLPEEQHKFVSLMFAGNQIQPKKTIACLKGRRWIVLQFNLELFGITNVSFDKSHAIIDGKHGRYSIHLGSGVIHKIGGHQINVVMIQGSKRGKIFLPFVDEDPKTAEIMTKVLTFAEDDKIKDPYIMGQVMS